MKAAVLTPDGFVLRRIPRPHCGRGQVLIRVVGCGVCAGDVHAYRQRERLRLSRTPAHRRFPGVGDDQYQLDFTDGWWERTRQLYATAARVAAALAR